VHSLAHRCLCIALQTASTALQLIDNLSNGSQRRHLDPVELPATASQNLSSGSRIDSLHAMELELAHTKDRVGYRRYLGRSAEAGDVALDAA
jgi:hypothetical protein